MPPGTTEIANNFYIQFGAVALLAASGWGVAWVLWRRLTSLQDKHDGLAREIITQAAALNETARDMVAMKELKSFIKDLSRDS